MESAAQMMNTPAFAMAAAQLYISGIEAETAVTRKVIAAVPQEKSEYRPDPKSKNAIELAWHIVTGEVGMLDSIANMKFGMENPYGDMPATLSQILAWYDENSKRALARVKAMTPEQLATPVDFYGVLNRPVFTYLGIVNNHTVHHRGQLSTYLRPMGSKVPSIYGGSADEPFKG